MLSFYVKFVQKDGQTDNGKTTCSPIFRYRGTKIYSVVKSIFPQQSSKLVIVYERVEVVTWFLPWFNFNGCVQYYSKCLYIV